MATWDPNLYLRYANERLRPAMDMLRSIPLENPTIIHDLGCGTGTVTVMLKKRWPRSRVTGVDSSPEMLERASALNREVVWVKGDLNTWQPAEPSDLVFSNAALHWLDDHERLFPRLLDGLSSGGVLAVQMPTNFAAPTHTAIAETVRGGSWRASLEPLLREHPVYDAATYYRILSPQAESVDIWETTYNHILEGDNPVVEWTKGSILRPLLAQLNPLDSERFLEQYGDRMKDAYPQGPDGKTVLPFKRIFIVVRR